MTIYLDVIWLLNFSFDALLLLLTAITLKRRIVVWRLLVGSLIGSILVIVMISPWSIYATHPIIKFTISLIIVGVAFGYKRFRYFIQGLLTFYFVTFMIGGGMIGVHYLLKSENGLMNNVIATNTSGFGDPISWTFVLVGFPLLWYYSRSRIYDIEMKKIKYDQIVRISISIEEITLNLRALIDSGNQLYDPITKNPVMVVDLQKVEQSLPPAIVSQSMNIESLSFEHEGEQPLWENRIRIIPYRGV